MYKLIYFNILNFIQDEYIIDYVLCFKKYHQEMLKSIYNDVITKRRRYNDKVIINTNLYIVQNYKFTYEISDIIKYCQKKDIARFLVLNFKIENLPYICCKFDLLEDLIQYLNNNTVRRLPYECFSNLNASKILLIKKCYPYHKYNMKEHVKQKSLEPIHAVGYIYKYGDLNYIEQYLRRNYKNYNKKLSLYKNIRNHCEGDTFVIETKNIRLIKYVLRGSLDESHFQKMLHTKSKKVINCIRYFKFRKSFKRCPQINYKNSLVWHFIMNNNMNKFYHKFYNNFMKYLLRSNADTKYISQIYDKIKNPQPNYFMARSKNIETLKFFVSKKGCMWDNCLRKIYCNEDIIEFLLDQKADINNLYENWDHERPYFKNKVLLKRIIENYKYPENYICFLNKSDFSEYFNKLDSEQKNKCILKCIYYDRYENFKLTKEYHILNQNIMILSIDSRNYKYIKYFAKLDIEKKFNPIIHIRTDASKKIKDIILQYYNITI